MVTVRLLAAITETKTTQDINRPKIFRSKLPYLSSENHNLGHTIPLTISMTILGLRYQTFSKDFS